MTIYGVSSGIQNHRAAQCQSNNNAENALVASNPESVNLLQQAQGIRDKTGIVFNHLTSLQQIAREYNCIIGIRPVDKLATELIEAGHPTKGFHIKGKSASWGPQSGLICENQKFSKLENADSDRIDKFNKQVKECIDDGYAVSIPLEVTKTRLDSLIKAGAIESMSLEDNQGRCTIEARGPGNTSYEFQACRVERNGEIKYEIQHEGQRLNVLAPKAGALPLTADYDLFTIAAHMSDFGPKDNLPVPDVSHKIFLKRINSYSGQIQEAGLLKSLSDPGHFYSKEDKDIGNASQRVREMIPIINNALVGTGEPVVHHNVDSSSPATDPAANYPVTFALPKKLDNFDELCVIQDVHELAELITTCKANGYYFPLNPLWEAELVKIHNPQFDSARNFFLSDVAQKPQTSNIGLHTGVPSRGRKTGSHAGAIAP